MPAVSKKQQRFFGMVRAAQKGEMVSPSPQIQRVASSIKKKDAKDFASTKHKGLPMKKFSEMRTHLGEEEYDHYRDKQLERGTWRGGSSSNNSKPSGKQPKGKTVLQKQADKKYGAGTSAMDRVKADIMAKYGKGAIMKTKKEAVEYTGPNKEDRKQIKKLDNPSYAKKLADYEKNMDPKKRQALRDKATKGMKFTHEEVSAKERATRDAGAIAKKKMRNKEHRKFVNFLDVDESKIVEAKVDLKTPEHKRATVRDKRYGNPHGSLELGGGIRKDRRADHEARRGVKKEEALDEVVKMSRAEYKKIHKDFKSDDPKNPRTTKYEKGKGTVSHPVKFTDSYEPDGELVDEGMYDIDPKTGESPVATAVNKANKMSDKKRLKSLAKLSKKLVGEEALDEKKGLWDNIHAKRKRGEKPAKKGDKDYPKTLNVESTCDSTDTTSVKAKKKRVALKTEASVGQGQEKTITERGDFWHPDPEKDKKLGGPGANQRAREDRADAAKPKSDPKKLRPGESYMDYAKRHGHKSPTKKKSLLSRLLKKEEYTVTNADKKGNTKAYQNFKKGMKGKDGKPLYKAADHMKESETRPHPNGQWEYHEKEGLRTFTDFLKEGNRTGRMMQKSKTQVTGHISADRGSDEKKNREGRKGLEKDLKKHGIGHKKGVGEYKYDSGETGREVSYQTSKPDKMSKRRFGKVMRRMGRKHGQESVITKDKDKSAKLHYTEKGSKAKSDSIGKTKAGKHPAGYGETSGTKARGGKLPKKTNKGAYHYG